MRWRVIAQTTLIFKTYEGFINKEISDASTRCFIQTVRVFEHENNLAYHK